MIALRVTLNGKPVCLAGAEDLAVLNTIVSAVGNLGPLTKRERNEPTGILLSVGGLTARAHGQDEHVCWVEQGRLVPGDKVEIELLETTQVDPPKITKPQEGKREREREKYEHAKAMYFALRDQFEEI